MEEVECYECGWYGEENEAKVFMLPTPTSEDKLVCPVCGTFLDD